MALSNAERQKRWRERRDQDQEKRQRFLRMCRDRYQLEKQSGKRKPVAQMTEREKRSARKKWRTKKRKDRERLTQAKRALETVQTPPTSPEHQPENREKSRQHKQSQKKQMKDKAKVYRDNKALKEEIETLKKRVSMYKKRYERQQNDMPETPRKSVKRLFRASNKRQLKKSLLEYKVLVEALRMKYEQKRTRDKRDISKILCEQTLKKYKMKIEIFEAIGCKTRFRKSTTCNNTLTKRIAEKVHSFYTRDDNSRLVTGTKQTKTYKKIKKQRRVVLHDLKTLHKKFHSEGKTKLSYSVFCKMRPFYVVFPRKSDRDTCMCKICNNTQFMIDALNRVNKKDKETPTSCVQKLVCSEKSQKCMEGKCSKCNERTIDIDRLLRDKDVHWYEWRTTRELRRMKKGTEVVEKEVYVTSKDEIKETADTLVDKLNIQLRRYASHIYRMNTQYQYYSLRKSSLSSDEVMIHIDFSENWECGYGSEIQTVHFGASKKQITLQTGMVFLNNQSPKSFCTVSDSLCHGPEAVWAHIKPVLKDIKENNPQVTKLEIFSDGPVTQYRQRGNFYLASIKGRELGFDHVQWSFFEASHGKGMPDAIGGAIKRRANNALRYGQDITSAKSFFDKLSGDSNVKMFLVSEISISDMAKCLEVVPLKTIKGTLNIHQVICEVNDDGEIYFRKLSCLCEKNHEHEGHTFDKAVLIEPKKSTNTKSRIKTDNNIGMKTEATAKKPDVDKNEGEKCNPRKRKQYNSTKDAKPKKERLVVKSFQSWKRRKTSGLKENIESNKEDVQKEPTKTFKNTLESLDNCKTFQALCAKVSEIPEIVRSVVPDEIFLYDNKLDVDFEAVTDMPCDIKIPEGVEDLYPVSVNTDGNCLPSCGSVFAFGTPERCAEIRAHIVKELTQNEDYYLNDANLQRGLERSSKIRSLSSQYAQYSEYFIPGMHLDATNIRKIYRRETQSITRDQSFMGIWQVFALASIIECPIYSVYPQKGNINVRLDLNRLILPRTKACSKPVHILWTNHREDIPLEHWVPNHFVALVPFSISPKDGPEKTSQCGERTTDEHNEDENANEVNAIKTQTKTEALNDTMVDENANEIKFEIPDIKESLNKYVVVNFKGRPYPGKITDIDETEVEIKCMHQVGKKNSNSFYWPKAVKDISWYDYNEILTVISEPQPIPNTNKFTIDESMWNKCLSVAC